MYLGYVFSILESGSVFNCEAIFKILVEKFEQA